MLQLFSAIKKNQFQVKPYNGRKLAYSRISQGDYSPLLFSEPYVSL